MAFVLILISVQMYGLATITTAHFASEAACVAGGNAAVAKLVAMQHARSGGGWPLDFVCVPE